MHVVLDTNVIISGTVWENSVAQKLILKLVNLTAKIFTTIEILQEYQKVLYRDFGLSIEDIQWIVDKILPVFKIIQTKETIDVIKDDPDDNKIIECALSSSADYIVTYDNHLLEIKNFRGIKIVKPEDLLKVL